MALSNSQLEAKLNKVEKNISNIQLALSRMQDDIDSRLHLSELQRSSAELQALIKDNAKLIVDLQKRLDKVLLPEETRYFLEEGEVEAFKSNFSQLKAMMSRFERLYNNLVAYGTQLGK